MAESKSVKVSKRNHERLVLTKYKLGASSIDEVIDYLYKKAKVEE